jgi:hypothetical protein
VLAFGEKGTKTRPPGCERHFLRSALRERFVQLAVNSNDFPKIASWFLCTSDCVAESKTFELSVPFLSAQEPTFP